MNEVGKVIFFFPWKKLKVLRDHIAIAYYQFKLCVTTMIYTGRKKRKAKKERVKIWKMISRFFAKRACISRAS